MVFVLRNPVVVSHTCVGTARTGLYESEIVRDLPGANEMNLCQR